MLMVRFIPEYEPAGEGGRASVTSSDEDNLPFQTSHTSNPVPDSPCSVNSDCSGSWIGIPRLVTRSHFTNIHCNLFRVKKNWVDVVTVPLLMAYMTR